MKYRYSFSYDDEKRSHHFEAAFTAKDDQDAVEELKNIIRNKFHYCYDLIELNEVKLMRIERIEFP